MTRIEECELTILQELVRYQKNGMREGEIKELCRDTIGGVNEGEEFFTRMQTKGYMTYLQNDVEFERKDGTKWKESMWYYPTSEGLFRFMDLQKMLREEFAEIKSTKIRTNWAKISGWIGIVILVVASVTLYFTCNPYQKETTTIWQDTLPRVDTNAVRTDTTKEMMITSGIEIDSETGNYFKKDSVEVFDANRKPAKKDTATPHPPPQAKKPQ